MEQEPKEGYGIDLESGLLSSPSLPENNSSLGWGWDLYGTSLVNKCPSSANLSEASRVFKASPRAWQVKSSSVTTPPPIQIGGLVTQEVSPEHLLGPWTPLLRVGAQGWTPNCWDRAFPKQPPPVRPTVSVSGSRGPCCVQCLSRLNHFSCRLPLRTT